MSALLHLLKSIYIYILYTLCFESIEIESSMEIVFKISFPTSEHFANRFNRFFEMNQLKTMVCIILHHLSIVKQEVKAEQTSWALGTFDINSVF